MQVVITGSQVFGKAFMEAYRQASSASIRASATAAARQKSGGVSLDEACKILDIEESSISQELVKKKYDYLFDVNSKEKAGSFYLQSKVYRAMERLNYELEQKTAQAAQAGSKPGQSAS
ncbi:Pam16p [Sugiyamaella lignohabitans]|uniref:Mitochondrial import inner membrane translocase subunit TIM16 n=1 Tax=Sugiyamaella lignohabitans TaxID=796027 RepID=A0A161HMN3_9ASCO|nr:Pam16p [Sugiyamaella lignohabitans]ANB15087.1 Pam16p [Sugiyamaella lignohabitans]